MTLGNLWQSGYAGPMTESAATEAMIAAARARWDAECAAQSRARAAEVARNRWSRSYPGTD